MTYDTYFPEADDCQAEAAAVYVSLAKQGLLEEALKDKESFQKIIYSVQEK